MSGQLYYNTDRWKLFLVEGNINNPEFTIVRFREKDDAPVMSTPSCLQQFSFESFFP